MKQTVLNLMHTTGVFAPFRMANRGKSLIVLYHRFSEGNDPRATSARALREQLAYLCAHYRIVPLSLIADYLAEGAPVPPGIAAITIDDGYRDIYDIAFPVLRRFNAPATVFVATDFIDQKVWLWTDKLRYLVARACARTLETTIDGRRMSMELDGRASRIEVASKVNSVLKQIADSEKDAAILSIAASLGVEIPAAPPREYSPLTWDQIREMQASGVDIGSHTVTHPILTNITDGRLRRELRQSRARLEAVLGRKVDLFCYPNGDYDRRVQEEVERAGYKCAVTDTHGLNNVRCDRFSLKRIHTSHDLAHFVQSTSGFEQVKNRLTFTRTKATAATAYVYLTELCL